MKFCSSCGEAMADNAMFCSKCGLKVGGDSCVNSPAPTVSQKNDSAGKNEEKSFFQQYLSSDALFSFTGRRNRQPYIVMSLLLCLGGGIIGAILQAVFGDAVAGLFYLILFVPNFTNTALRLHDINLSAWYMWAGFAVIIVGALLNSEVVIGIGALVALGLSFVLLFLKGTIGPNKYGEDPLQ